MSIHISYKNYISNVLAISVFPIHHDNPHPDMWVDAIQSEAERLRNLQYYRLGCQGRLLYSLIVIGRFVRAFLLSPGHCQVFESAVTFVRPLEIWNDVGLIHDLLDGCARGIGFP